MATTTPNFGWPVPTSTDLVKDGATAIEALGDAIDASLVDLEGGTTGQILSKASNTDMDFTWITNDVGDITAVTAGTGISGGGTSGAVTITNSMATAIDAKGDLVVGTGADAFARLAVGADNAFLSALASESTGLKWSKAWISYTPTWTNISLGNGSVGGSYLRIGNTVIGKVSLTLGSTTTFTGAYLQVSLPTNANANYESNGNVIMFDVGTAVYNGLTWLTEATKINVLAMNSSGTYSKTQDISSTIPFTWTTGDIVTALFTYEAA